MVYQILDEQAVQNVARQPAPKRRARIVKKEADRVYSASKDHSENVEKKKAAMLQAVSKDETEQVSEIQTVDNAEPIPDADMEEQPKRKRGRPRKTSEKTENEIFGQ